MKKAKDQLRQKMKALRQEVLGNREEAGLRATANFLATFDFPPGAVIAAYWAMKTELPTLPLMEALHKKGYRCCLPRIHENQSHLTFAPWVPGSAMISGYHDILTPKSDELVEPDVIILPLLAFTRDGHRLGFGRGHYDHTLEYLRGKKPIMAIGYAYAQQEVDSLPQDQYDQVLDCIVTDKEVLGITI